MTPSEKLQLAQIHIDSLTDLLGDGPYAGFMSSHLLSIKYEVERQLALTKSNKSAIL